MKFTLALAALVSLVAATPTPEVATPLEARSCTAGAYHCYVNLSVSPGYAYLGQCASDGNTIVQIARCNCQYINGIAYCV